MGNRIPSDPTLVDQILKISASYSPPPPEGFISPMAWGVEGDVIERFSAAGASKDKISFARGTYTFNYPGAPSAFVDAFRKYYGPTMNAFEAADRNGRAHDLQTELETLFSNHLSLIKPAIQFGRARKLPDQSDNERRDAAKLIVEHSARSGIKCCAGNRHHGVATARQKRGHKMALDGRMYCDGIEAHALPQP
jgi:hypothetical protein